MVTKIIYGLVVVVLIAGIAIVVIVCMQPPPSPESTSTPRYTSALPEDVLSRHLAKKSIIAGDENAPLKIEACLPIDAECHKTTPSFIAKLAQKHPKLIHVEVVDMYGPDGKRILDKYKSGCSQIFFNGESIVKLKKESGEEEVYFTGPLNAGYTLKDIALAAQQVLKEVKGDTIEVPDLTAYVDEAESKEE